MKNIKILIVFASFFILSSCEKNDNSNSLEGDVVGFINLVDEFGNYPLDKSDVEITIENTQMNAITNIDGRFSIPNVPAGIYNVLYKNDGYGTYKSFSNQFVGGNMPGLIENITLYQKPTFELIQTDLSLDNELLQLNVELSNNIPHTAMIFVNDSANVSYYNKDYASVVTMRFTPPVASFNHTISLSHHQYSAGQEIYIVIYFFNAFGPDGYYHKENKKSIPTNFFKTEVIPFTME